MGTNRAAGTANGPVAPAPHKNGAAAPAARAAPAGSVYSVHTLRFRVRYAETDAMRVAHHAAYAVWLEAGRVEWIRSLGFPFAEIEARGHGHVVRELRIRYYRAVRFDQELALRIALASTRGPRLTFGYRLYDAQELDADPDGAQPVALAATEMVWVNADGRPTRLPTGHALARVIAGLQRYPDWASW
jgi:acyl-CoA thioester hydrolase